MTAKKGEQNNRMPAYKVWKERKKEMSALNSISSDNMLRNLEDRKTFKKIIKTQRTYH